MRSLEVEGRRIGDGQPVFVIAEAADSHLGSIEDAKEMARQAKLAGADCIKFQHHLPDEEMLPDVPMSDNFREPLYEFLKKHALRLDQHVDLRNYCRSIGIPYLCTPFSYKAAQELAQIGVGSFKIGSGEFSDLTSLEKIAALGRPMILSSGMSTPDEVKDTYAHMKKWGGAFAILNCVSEYPPVYEDMNLRVITTLREWCPDIVIGHSDHTPDLYTAFAAVALGAQIIEKHITLSKLRPGPDQSVSIDMRDLAELVDGIRKIERALGTGEREVHGLEKPIRTWAFRSVVTTRDIPAGTRLSTDMLWTKRPGTGIPSKELPSLLGRKTVRDVKRNTLISWQDVE